MKHAILLVFIAHASELVMNKTPVEAFCQRAWSMGPIALKPPTKMVNFILWK